MAKETHLDATQQKLDATQQKLAHDLGVALVRLIRSAARQAAWDVVEEMEELQPPPALINTDSLAREIGCSTSTVHRLRREAACRLGR